MELVNIWHSVFVFGVMVGRLVVGRSETSLCGDPRIFRVSFSKADSIVFLNYATQLEEQMDP